MVKVAEIRVKAIKTISGKIIPFLSKIGDAKNEIHWLRLLYQYYQDEIGATDLAKSLEKVKQYEEALDLYATARAAYNQGTPKYLEFTGYYMRCAYRADNKKIAKSEWKYLKGFKKELGDWIKKVGKDIEKV